MGTLINICGQGRSGSTMLDLMIGNGPEAFSCGEVYAWFRPWRAHHRKINCSCGENPCPVWNKIKDHPENEFHFNVLEKLDVQFVVDSSKDLRWLIDSQEWAKQKGIRVFNLLLYKEPNELAYSHWKRGRPPMSFRQSFIAYHSALINLDFPFVTIPFRELAENTACTLQAICKLVGMKYYTGKEEFWKQITHQAFGSMGTRKQVKAGVSRVRNEQGFSEKFRKSILPLVEQEIEADRKLSDVIAALKQRSLAFEFPEEGMMFKKPLVMPPWYYLSCIKSMVRRRFPQKWKPYQ